MSYSKYLIRKALIVRLMLKIKKDFEKMGFDKIPAVRKRSTLLLSYFGSIKIC